MITVDHFYKTSAIHYADKNTGIAFQGSIPKLAKEFGTEHLCPATRRDFYSFMTSSRISKVKVPLESSGHGDHFCQ